MRQLKKRKLINILILIIIYSIILAGCQSYAKDEEQFSDEEKIIIRFSHVVGEDTPKGEAARRFANLVNERSKGKIEVQVFANGSLYKDGEEWEALQKGNIQMIAPATAKLTGYIPELQIFDLPFFFKDLNQIHALVNSKVGETIFSSARKLRVEPLAIWDNGFKQLTSRNHSLRKPEDFRGLTFRIMPSNLLREQFNLLGAKAEAINFNDVYTSLEYNNIDGQENTISNIYTKRFYEVQGYLTLSNHGYLGYLVMVNQSFWNELDPEYQKIIADAMDEVTEWQQKKAEELQTQQLEYIRASKSIYIEELTIEEWEVFRQKYEPLYKRFEQRFSSDFINLAKEALLIDAKKK